MGWRSELLAFVDDKLEDDENELETIRLLRNPHGEIRAAATVADALDGIIAMQKEAVQYVNSGREARAAAQLQRFVDRPTIQRWCRGWRRRKAEREEALRGTCKDGDSRAEVGEGKCQTTLDAWFRPEGTIPPAGPSEEDKKEMVKHELALLHSYIDASLR